MPDPHELHLTNIEHQILCLMVNENMTTEDISVHMLITSTAVKFFTLGICQKLKVNKRSDAIRRAIELGLCE